MSTNKEQQEILVRSKSEIPDGFTGKVIWDGGVTTYLLNGIRHREDGPAIVREDGYCSYFLNGKRYCSKASWKRALKNRKG
jgi:hypothetical protein